MERIPLTSYPSAGGSTFGVGRHARSMRSPSAATALDGAGHVNGVAVISRVTFSFEPRYNIAPSQSVPVIMWPGMFQAKAESGSAISSRTGGDSSKVHRLAFWL